MPRRKFLYVLTALSAVLTLPLMVLAQEEATLSAEERIAKLEAAVTAAQTSGDNGWMLVSCALVLLMTAPGLALFYGGLVRRKNALSTMMQSFILMAIVSILWFAYGYSISFGEGNAFMGSFEFAFLKGVGLDPNPSYAATIPQQTFMLFQLMFAIITPALITGAFAERIKFSAMVVFTILWATFIYNPLAHMVWGKGGFLNAALGGVFPALDFAGGTVVHISSGVSALVCAIFIGKRIGYPERLSPPHSMVLSFIGAALLWVGWFGFNAGSALSAGGLATSAFATTHFATAAGVLGWLLAEWMKSGKPSVLGGISGAVAGLVGVTPASGFVTPGAAIIIGFLAGALCFVMVTEVKKRLGYDDSLDVFGVHGAAGTLGALLTGVFATSAINPIFKDADGNPLPVGLLEGNSSQLMNQLVGVGLAWGIAAVGTLLILFLVNLTIGFRVNENDEITGLDLSQHGEAAYAMEGSDIASSYSSPMSHATAPNAALGKASAD